MEVKNASDVKLIRSKKKKKKNAMMEQEIESVNAESKEEKGTCLETEQSSPPRKKRKRKMKENSSSIDEKKTDSFLKEEANSLTNTLSGTDSNVQALENTCSDPGPKEEPTGSETKRKKKKAEMNAESALELKDKQENPLIDENKVSDSHLKVNKNLDILENLPGLEGARLNESETKKKRKKRKTKETKLGATEDENISSKSNVKDDNEAGNKVSDSHLKVSKNLDILEHLPGLEGTRLNESETKRKKKKRKTKETELGATEDENISSKSNVKDDNEDGNKVSDSHLKVNKNLDILENLPGLEGDRLNESETKRKKKKRKTKETELGAIEDENISSKSNVKDDNEAGNKVSDSHLKVSKNLDILEHLPGLEGARLNESETKRKKKRKTKETELGAIEGENISSKSNANDDNEAGNKNMCAETQIIDGKEDHMSILEAVESKNTKKVSEEAFGCSTGTESDLRERKRKKRKKSEESPCKNEERKDIEIETETEQVIPSPFPRNCVIRPKKKLLVLDLNGILVDVVQSTGNLKPHARVSGKGVFKRPFCDEFLDFCFRTFKVGIWSSRVEKNVDSVVNFLMGEQWKRKLLFCWSRNMCTITKFKTLENKEKPLVLKELKKIWDKCVPGLPWKKGKYDESNTLLLDDSPYKALRNPANTAIFPYLYQYTDAEDCSLASGGDIRKYLERLAAAENVQKFVEQNPFGQPAITEADPHWDFYSQI